MAISPAISITPTDIEFQKPVTVQLPTCIAVHSQGENQEQAGGKIFILKQTFDLSLVC